MRNASPTTNPIRGGTPPRDKKTPARAMGMSHAHATGSNAAGSINPDPTASASRTARARTRGTRTRHALILRMGGRREGPRGTSAQPAPDRLPGAGVVYRDRGPSPAVSPRQRTDIDS